jgi:hypothetical protein
VRRWRIAGDVTIARPTDVVFDPRAWRRPIDMVLDVTESDRPRRMGSTTATPAGEVRAA